MPPQKKILVVDDEDDILHFLELVLREKGFEVLVASSGQEALTRAQIERPDLVLLDMHLPDISGLEVVRVLNEEIASGALRVTLLTADSLSMDIVKAMSLGASEYWLKPLTLDGLENGLRRALMR